MARKQGWRVQLWQPRRCSPLHRHVVQIPRWGRADQEPSKHYREQDNEINSFFPEKTWECWHKLIIHPVPVSKMGDWRAQKAFSMWQESIFYLIYLFSYLVHFFIIIIVYCTFLWELKAFLCLGRKEKTAQMLKNIPKYNVGRKRQSENAGVMEGFCEGNYAVVLQLFSIN